MFNRSAILRDAHARTARRMSPHWSQRYGDRWDATLKAWVPKATYRAIFAGCLRMAWADAKSTARHAAYEAEEAAEIAPMPDAVRQQVADIRLFAGVQAFTGQGQATYRVLMAEASMIEQAARLALVGALPC